MNRTVLALAISGAASVLSAVGQNGFVRKDDRVTLQSPLVNEASGLAASTRNGRFLWIVNDSGSPAVLHLTDTEGANRGLVKVEDAENIDWEDLASFQSDGISYLLIADTGDNRATREVVTLYIVKEPVLPNAGEMIQSSVKPAWKIRFRFEKGPRDCEAVAVDAKSGKVILISKRTTPPEIYELPLRPESASQILTAKKIGETAVSPPDGVLPLPFIKQPTGLDLSADASEAAVITYYGIFVFSRHRKQNWSQAFAMKPMVLRPHGLQQAEAVSFSPDGNSIYAISEGKNSPLLRYSR